MSKQVVLVTRPDLAGSELCALINAQGNEAIHFPTILFAPPRHIAQLEENIRALGECDWIIFVSPQAVIESIPYIRRAWPNFPASVYFAAVGKGTADALKMAGYHCIYPEDDWGADALMAMPDFQQLAGKQVAIVRGEGGLMILEPVLSERGANVISVIVYQRVMPAGVHTLPRQDITMVVCTSGTSVTHLKQMVGDILDNVPMVVVSERIKALAQNLGYKTIWVAKNASHAAILEVINHVR